MYHGFSDALDGFTKRIFLPFSTFIFCYIVSAGIGSQSSFLLPIYVLFSHGIPSLEFPASLALTAVGEAVLMISLAYRRFRIPAVLVLLYPASLLIFTWIAFRSLVYSLTGYGFWKGRGIAPPLIKL